MKKLLKVAAILTLLILPSITALGSDYEIAVWDVVRFRTNVTVMEADGSSPNVIHEGPKWRNESTQPSWSPAGDWIALIDRDEEDPANSDSLYKVRVDGSDLTKILCAAPSDTDDQPFGALRGPQWSPDGDWILVVGENRLGIVSANALPDAACDNQVTLLYVPDPAWWIEGTPAWNTDGSRVGLFESEGQSPEQTDFRLQILEVAIEAGEPFVVENPLWPLDEGLLQVLLGFRRPWDLDWQRQAGDLLTFTSWAGDFPYYGVNMVSWIDSDSGAWGHLTEGEDASWSPDNGRIVYNRIPSQGQNGLIVSDLSYNESGIPSILTSQTIGSSRGEPDWKRGAFTDCGDLVCEGAENACNCAYDCDLPPMDEDPSTPPMCTDGIDNDCDGSIDCEDNDCLDDLICNPPPVVCSDIPGKSACNAEPSCRWNNRNKVCV